ncbi:MAG: hypothetical protein QXL67_00375 [Candidatus Bathyarchaeia archaeon]
MIDRLKPLSFVYWGRVALGFVVGALEALIRIDDLFTLASMSILVYLVTYYLCKWRLINKVKKPSSLATTGIGAYFITWITSLILLYTLLYSPI